MKTQTIEIYNGEKLETFLYFAHEFKGRGGWNITCEVSYKKEKKNFRHYTTDSMFIDSLSDMKANGASFDDFQNAYYNHSFHNMEADVIEWLAEILEKENEEN